MKTIYLLLFFGVLFGCSSCHKLGLCKDEPLTMQRVDFEGNELRTDGFYYGYPDTDSQGVLSYRLLVFYRNGVVLVPGRTDSTNMEEYIIGLMKIDLKEEKTSWGAFEVENHKIQIEYLPGGFCGSPIALQTYTILNDSTLVLTNIMTKDGGRIENEKKNEVFHFRPLSVKPDSVNNIIK